MDMIKCQAAQARAACANLQANASHNAVDEAINATSEEMAGAQETLKKGSSRQLGFRPDRSRLTFASTVAKKFSSMKQTALDLWKEAEAAKEQIPEDLNEEFQQALRDAKPASEVEQAVANLKADLETSHGVSESLIKRYEELQVVVAELRERVTEQRESTRQESDNIHNLMVGPS